MLRRNLVLITSSLLTIVLLIHFSIIFVYLSPENLFRNKYWDSIYSYMNPLFTQNWNLFAPNPVSRHESLQLRLRYIDANGRTQTTHWMEMTKPIIKDLQTNHFSPNARLTEFVGSGLHDYVWQEGKRKQGALKTLKSYTNRILERYPEKFPVNGAIDRYQLRVEVNEFPRFDKRHLPDAKGKFTYTYSDWFPYDSKGVTPL